jgi:hypothetical protein
MWSKLGRIKLKPGPPDDLALAAEPEEYELTPFWNSPTLKKMKPSNGSLSTQLHNTWKLYIWDRIFVKKYSAKSSILKIDLYIATQDFTNLQWGHSRIKNYGETFNPEFWIEY